MKLKKLLTLLMALCIAMVAFTGVISVGATAGDFSTKKFSPDVADFVNYWGGAGNINPEDGDGVTTFAHAGLTVPLKGDAIEIETSFMLYSKRTVEEGGDGVDAWCTYSFTNRVPGNADNTFPSYSGIVSGFFLHITNYSSTSAPNCVEVQVVESQEGGATRMVNKFFLDNANTKVGSQENVKLKLSITKVADYNYTLKFVRLSDEEVLKEVTGLDLDEELFVNEYGQTYFGTALYEGAGCDGNHWEHRSVNIYSFDAYTFDASNASVVLEKDTYVYEEGKTFKPEVVVMVGNKLLENDVDYYLEYANNKAVGTAEVNVIFIGEYSGNTTIVKEFTITEAGSTETSDTASNGDNTAPAKGCGGVAGAGSVLAFAVLGVAIALKKRA